MIKQKILDEGAFTESETARIMKSLLMAVNHCHANNVAHRDIKPENIIIGKDGSIKLIDFGLSKVAHIKDLKSIVGSPYYIAPEVLSGAYGLECDIWSLGVILFTMLSGMVPFNGSSVSEIFDKIQIGSYSFSGIEWNMVSEEAKDLITGMLKIDITDRLTARQ